MPEEGVRRGKWTFAHCRRSRRFGRLARSRKRRKPPQSVAAADKAQDVGRADQRVRRRTRRASSSSATSCSTASATETDTPAAGMLSMTGGAFRDCVRRVAPRLIRDAAATPRAPRCAAPNPTGWIGISGHARGGGVQLQGSVAAGAADDGPDCVQAPKRWRSWVEREERDPRLRPAHALRCWESHPSGTFRARPAASSPAAGSTKFKEEGDGEIPAFAAEGGSPCLRTAGDAARALAASSRRQAGIDQRGQADAGVDQRRCSTTCTSFAARGRAGASAFGTHGCWLDSRRRSANAPKGAHVPRRTDSRALPWRTTCRRSARRLDGSSPAPAVPPPGGFAREIIKQRWVKPNRRITAAAV